MKQKDKQISAYGFIIIVVSFLVITIAFFIHFIIGILATVILVTVKLNNYVDYYVPEKKNYDIDFIHKVKPSHKEFKTFVEERR